VKKCFVNGTAADFTGKSQNTAYIERFNLTLRQPYLQRQSLGDCKSKSNVNAILWIKLFDYNYRRPHKSLRLAVKQPASPRFQKVATSNPSDDDRINESGGELTIFVVSRLFG
jgi:hypothetical protein